MTVEDIVEGFLKKRKTIAPAPSQMPAPANMPEPEIESKIPEKAQLEPTEKFALMDERMKLMDEKLDVIQQQLKNIFNLLESWRKY